jgi:hypothetical protein
VAFNSSDNKYVATGNNKGEVYIYEVATRERKARLDTDRGQFILCVAFVRARVLCGGGGGRFSQLGLAETERAAAGVRGDGRRGVFL